MKSILHQLVSKVSLFFQKDKKEILTENGLGLVPKLFVRDEKKSEKRNFFSALATTFVGFAHQCNTLLFGTATGGNTSRFAVGTSGLFMLLMFNITQSYGQISYATAGSNYTQNFNNLYGTVPADNTTQAATILPSGWLFTEAGANANTTLRNDNGSSGTGDTYFDGTTASNERAFGSYASGSLTSQFGAVFTNSTGGTLTQFTLTYTGEQWKDGGSSTAVFNKLTFSYAVNPTSLTVGTYTNNTNLDFTALVNNTTSDATTDGNAANRRTTITFTVTGISWTAGQTLYLRWTDANDTGNDDNLAIDDLTFTAGVAATPTITGAATTAAFTTTYGTASAVQTFSVSGANLTTNLVANAPTGFEVSSDGTTYGATASFTQTGGNASGSLRIRLKSSALVSGTYNSQNITLTSTGATTVNITTPSSGNAVTAKALTISGITANNKVFDGNTSATLSGTAALVGVVSGDTVTLGGTTTATFASSSPGTGITVNVTGYTIGGASVGNYTLTQPTLSADITSAPTPVINSSLTASATYGVVSTTYNITGTNGPINSYNATGLPTGLSVNTSTGAITGTPSATPGAYNVSISATNAGGTGSATLVYTIVAKGLTVSGATADSKEYDRTTAATITGSTLVGIVGADVVTISNTGAFASATVGTAIAITSTQTLGGANAGNYTLTLPTGLTANITAKALTIASAAAQSKNFDGNTSATITGTLTGVIALDVVTPNLSGTFASSAIGTGIAVTSTSTISGADAGNYTLTQPTGLTANINAGPTSLVAGDIALAAINSTNPDRFAIVLLKAITTGTVINFTDNGFTGTDTTGRTGEGFLTYTANADLPYGTVLTWFNGMTITGTGWSSNNPTNFAFNGSGDQFFIFQGATANWASQSGITLVYGLNYGIALSATSGAGNTLQPNASILPTTAFLNLPTATFANGYYSGNGASSTAVTLCGSTILADLVTPAKWFGTTATAATFPAYTVIAVCPTPTITGAATAAAFTTTYGTASAAQTFSVSGVNLTANIVATAPSGFEVSSNGTTFGSTASFTQTSGSASGTLSIRLAATALVGGSYDNLTIALTSIGATTVNITTAASGNTVSPVNVTPTGLTANSKLYDGNTTATLSGTPTLSGVIPADVANVILGGTPVATFASAAVGTGIAVTVTGYTISGSAAGNYTLTQPTGLTADITAVASPVISSALTASATYGVASTTYTITASETPTSFNATGLPTGLTVNTTTGEITGTPTVAPGSFNVTISATNIGGTGSATLVYTITPKALTVTGATANNKVYDRTTAATITGSTLVGIVGTDVVTVSNTGTFDTANAGTVKTVTSTQTLSGADAAKYTLTVPTGLTADITPKALTIGSAAAQNKNFDGNTTATITGTLTGVIAPDAVTLNLSGTFASSAVGTGIVVTSTSTVTGADASNYSLTQPTGLTANIISVPTTLAAGDIAIVGYSTTGSAVDNFAILVLKDLNQGTVFYINDNELATASSTAFTDLAEGEASFTVKTGQTIPAGTVIVLPWGSAAVSTTTYDWSTTSGAGLSTGADELYIYNAASITATTPTSFIYYAKIGTALGAIPSSLTLGTTAINPTGNALRYKTAGALYTGCVAALQTAIGNTATNWNNTGAIALAASDWTFTVLPTCTPTIIGGTTTAAFTATFGSVSAAQSFSVAGFNLTTNLTATAPTGFEVSNDGITYGATATFTQTGGNASGTLRIRLAATAAVGSYNALNIVLSSTGAASVNITTPATGNVVNAAATPTITGAATTAAFTTTIGNASAAQTFPISGADLTANITATAPTGFEVSADGTTYATTATFVQTSGIASGTLSIRIAASAAAGTYNSQNIVLSSTGATAVNITTPASGNIVFTPTTLAAGDIAVIGYNTSGAPDNFAILVLKDLNAGTTFYINDNEVTTAGDASFADLNELEASFTVKAGQTILAGTVIVLPWGGAAVSTTTYDWSNTTGAGLGTTNDELYVYTASSITATTPTAFIYYAKIGTSVSAIPSGLTIGTTAIAPSGALLRYATTGALYVGCPAALLAAIGNTATNWNATGAATLASADWSFTVEAICKTIAATGTLSALTTTYGTASSETSFDVSGSSLTAGILVTPPTGFEVSLTSGSGFATSLTVGSAGTIPTTTVYVRLAATTTFGAYSGNIVLTSAGAPTVNVATASSTVNKLTITTSGAVASNKIYDRTTTATITGATPVGAIVADGIAIVGNGVFDTANAGTAIPVTTALTLTGSNISSYILTQPTGLTANITAKELTLVSASANNKVYDANTSATLNGTFTGVIAPDDVSLIQSASFSSATVGTSKPVTSSSFITGIDSGNYTFTQPTGLVADITVKALTIANATAQNKVFDGNTTATITGTLTGVIDPDNVVLNLSGSFASSAVGNGIVVTSTSTISGGDASNYALTQPTGLTANITAAPLLPQTITFNTLSDVVYGDTVTLGATASSGLAVSYEITSGNAFASVSGNVVTTLGVGTVTIKATQAGNSTYDTAPFVTQTLNITPKEITATATANNKVYDGNDIATIGGTLNGVINSDVVVFNGFGNFVSSTVGTAIAVNSSSYITGANAGNYTFTQPTGLSANITPKVLTVSPGSAVANNKVYDTTNVAAITGGDLVGVVGADDVYILDFVATFNNANVGIAKPVTTAFTIDGANALNYTLTQPTGLTANITAVALTINGITGVNRVYNGNTTATLSGTPALVGVLGSDVVTISGTPVTSFATKTVGNAKPITVTGYTIVGAQAPNYTVTQPTGITANITPYALTITSAVAQNKAFDSTTAATISGTLSAALGADVVTLVGTGTFASSAVGTGIAVTSTATVAGTDGANYIINPQPTGLTANITAATPYTYGRLVVARVGATGQASAPTSAATAVFLDEYSTTGTAGVSVALPTTSTSTVNRVLESGSATSEIQLNLSANGQYLVLGGYDAVLGSASAGGATNPRVIARVNNFGTVATLPIGLTHTSGFRSATSFDGSRFWTAGNGNGVTTVPFTTSTITAATPTVIYSGTTNLRTVSIFNNQLYYTTGSGTNGLYKVGTGLPTTAGQTVTNPVVLADPYAYSMVNRGGNNWNLYMVVGSTTAANQGIYKYSSVDNGVTWTANGSIKPTTAPTFGVTAKVNGSTVEIYATTATGTASTILKVTDSAAFNATISAVTPTVLVTAPANTFFRGIAFAPTEPISASVLSGNATVCAGTTTNLSVAITNGAGPFTVVYNNGTSNFTVSNYTSGTNIPVTPATTTTYTLVSVTDAYGFVGSGASGSALITVTPLTTTGSVTTSICAGATYVWPANGTSYTTAQIGTTFVSGCNTATLNLTINPLTTNGDVTTSICNGDTYVWPANGQSYTTAQTGTTFVSGCNTATLNLTINTPTNWYADTDGDTYGAGVATLACTQPSGYVANNTDCNDTDATKHSSFPFYVDGDLDGYGAGASTVSVCAVNATTPPSGYSLTNDDCDDTNALLNPTNPCSTSSIVNLKLFVQGYYTGAGTMASVKNNQDGVSATDEVEDVVVELHDATTFALVATTIATLKTDGTAVCTFSTAPSGSFLIAVKGSNLVQTWSASPQSVGSTPISFDFSSSDTQAYTDGSQASVLEIEPGVWSVYSGDNNHDDSVDLSDVNDVATDSDASNFGILATDLNGDGAIDLSDVAISVGNSDNSIYSQHP